MLHKKWLLLGSFFAMVLLTLDAIPSVGTYINAVKNNQSTYLADSNRRDEEALPVFASATLNSTELKKSTHNILLETIVKEAEKRKIAPINAKIDPVWKAIPGYNGLEVDIEETLKLAEHHLTQNKINYVMKEVQPRFN